MFGFSVAVQLFQGSAQRTWNCVSQFTNLLWYKLYPYNHQNMPRSRRRHHSRSRSRSRSHSHDRERDAKRRKIDGIESPPQKRSVSPPPLQPQDEDSKHQELLTNEEGKKEIEDVTDVDDSSSETEEEETQEKENSSVEESSEKNIKNPQKPVETEKLKITPQKTMSPKQLQRKLESEKKKKQKEVERQEREKQKQLERDEKEKQRQTEKEKKEREKKEKEDGKIRERQEKEEQKAKERELKEEKKRKEQEEKEQKRKEKEEREEQKKKERERKLEEKNKEKQKQEEQKQKAAAAFVNFFVLKKSESTDDKKVVDQNLQNSNFKPFEIKTDMRLPPARRSLLTTEEKDQILELLKSPQKNASSYLKDLKNNKLIGKSTKTWPFVPEEEGDDVVIVEEDFGETICEEKPKITKMKSKFLKFHENRRPAYFGTWRKKSEVIKPRQPLMKDSDFFDYEVDSDDDWEEEEQGESLNGSEDEAEKENDVEGEKDDFEHDDFLVPHGYLSDDEIDDEATAKLSPESQKQKLKLLQDQFDQDMKSKTHKLQPRFIGCIWFNKDGSNIDDSVERHLKPLAILTNGNIIVRKRNELNLNSSSARKGAFKILKEDLIKPFLKLIHGNTNNQKNIAMEFLAYCESNNVDSVQISRKLIVKNLKHFAEWKKCADEGPLLNKLCWNVHNEYYEKYLN